MQRLSSLRLLPSTQQFVEEIRCVSSLFAREIHSCIVSLQHGAPGAPSSDPFTQQLQQRTERELADILAAAQAKKGSDAAAALSVEDSDDDAEERQPARSDEIGGPKGKEPTRYGDWEGGGRCSDF